VKRRIPKTSLINAEERHAAHPDTFDLPDHGERVSLAAGDFVKLGWTLDKPRKNMPAGERMWVKVTGGDAATGYAGTLSNQPFFFDWMQHGDAVSFGPEHVLDVMRAAEAVVL
jgi:hypothetical protein